MHVRRRQTFVPHTRLILPNLVLIRLPAETSSMRPKWRRRLLPRTALALALGGMVANQLVSVTSLATETLKSVFDLKSLVASRWVSRAKVR